MAALNAQPALVDVAFLKTCGDPIVGCAPAPVLSTTHAMLWKAVTCAPWTAYVLDHDTWLLHTEDAAA